MFENQYESDDYDENAGIDEVRKDAKDYRKVVTGVFYAIFKSVVQSVAFKVDNK